MESFIKRLRSLGWAGAFVAGLIQTVFAIPGVTVSAVIGVIAGVVAAVQNLFLTPPVQVAIAVFLAVLWTWIGVAVLRDRKRPRLTLPAPDYRYGLIFEGIHPIYVRNDPHMGLQFVIALRNFSSGPIRYSIEEYDVRLGTRALPLYRRGEIGSFLQRGAGKTATRPPFSAEDVRAFYGQRTDGTIQFKVVYGSPGDPPVRRFAMLLSITIVLNDDGSSLGFSHGITEESDDPINGG